MVVRVGNSRLLPLSVPGWNALGAPPEAAHGTPVSQATPVAYAKNEFMVAAELDLRISYMRQDLSMHLVVLKGTCVCNG